MTDPWFDPSLYAWIPGTALGVLGGAWGAVGGRLIARGKGKGFVVGTGAGLVAASLLCLVGGGAALAAGQPYGVWYGLLLPGVMGTALIGTLLGTVVRPGYRQAELRKLEAADLP